MSTPLPSMGCLFDAQRRRAQALTIACALFPYATDQLQVRIAAWIVAGRWEREQ